MTSTADQSVHTGLPVVAKISVWRGCVSAVSTDSDLEKLLNLEGANLVLESDALARIAELEQDAARYRWLRDRLAIEDIERAQAEFWGSPDEAESKKTDAAIDAALKQAKDAQ